MRRVLLAILMMLAPATQAAAEVILIPLYQAPPGLPEPKPSDYSNIRSVAVISTLGDHFLMSTNHFMAPAQKQLDIHAWAINDEIKARFAQYLPHFTFKDVSFDPAKLANEPSTLLDHPDNLSSFLAGLPKDAVDAYIIVRPAMVDRGPGYNGLALQNGGAFGADASPVVWANFQIIVVDARTSKILAKSYSRLRLKDNAPPSFAGMVAPNTLKLNDNFDLTPEQIAVLHRVVSFVLSNAIAETLRSLGLGDALPAPGARVLRPIPPDQDPYRRYKTVAIVSALGDQLRFENAGSIFDQTVTNISFPDWHIDDFVEGAAKTQLAPHFQVVPIPAAREAMAKAVTWEDRKAPPKVAPFTPEPSVDIYLVFINMMLTAAHGWQEKGLGVLHNGSIISFPKGTFSFANYGVVVIDAKTMSPVAYQGSLAGPTGMYPGPFKPLNDAAWSGTAKTLTEGQATLVHGGLDETLGDSVRETLLQLGMLGVIPVPGGMAPPPAPNRN